MIKELAKVYDPSVVEERLYTKWCEKKYFHAEVDKSKKPFSIVMPPPNITGQLHMGHALDNTIQDILIRWKRMSGYNTLWVPGIDHASISTEVKVVAQIAKEGLKKEDLGREGFLKRCWQWKEQYLTSSESLAQAVTGTGYVLQWTRAVRKPYLKHLCVFTTRDTSTKAKSLLTGALSV